MKNGLIVGTEVELEFTVTPAMCPAYDDEIVHEVCSTWEIVHYMEMAGRKMLLGYLEANEEGVGSHASCDHVGPALVGSAVRVTARATGVSDRELTCECAAYCRQRLIATGRTVQKIFPRNVLERILRKET